MICLYPTISKKGNKTINFKQNTKKHIPESQALDVLKSLHECTDLHWLNVFINRFWMELSDSSAQAYRLKKYLKKNLEDIPGTGIIRSIEVVDVDIGIEGPQIENIRIISEKEMENLVASSCYTDPNVKMFDPVGTNSDSGPVENIESEFYKKDKSVDCDKVFNEIFKNVHSVLSILFKGSIKIRLQIEFPKNITLHTNVFINKLKGDVLTRFPSLSYNTRLEYAFLKNPDMEIEIEAGVSKGDSDGYFKKSISNFIRRTIKYTILKSLVYPSFNTLYLPLIVPSFRNVEHKITAVPSDNNDVHTVKYLDNIKESLSLYLDIDYKIIETCNDITIRRTNFLLNEKERIYCANFTIPDCALNSSHFTTQRNYIYEKLTIKESKIMNQIYDLSILKECISSFKETVTLKNYSSVYSLVEIRFIDKSYNFLRLVHNDTIYFQKNDEKQPEFIIFTIRSKELFVYHFTTTQSFNITKNRLIKLKNKLEMKPGKKISLNKIYKYSKNALWFWKNNPSAKPKISQVSDVKNILEDVEYPNLLEKVSSILNNPINQQKTYSYKFKCPSDIIFDILVQDDVRVKFISDQTKIFRFLSANESFRSLAVENKDEDNGDFVMHTFNNKNILDNKKILVDLIDNKKIVYELEETVYDDFSEKFIDMVPVTNKEPGILYKTASISENNLKILNKRKKITFKDDKPLQTFSQKEDLRKINFQRIIEKYETHLNIYVEDGVLHSKENHLYESIYTRITKQEILNIVRKSDFEKLDLKKELRKDFYGDVGGVYIEFKTVVSDDFKFSLYSTAQKRNVLEIHKVISSRPFKMIIPIYEEDILLLKLVPKFQNNSSLEIKVVNLPKQYYKETMIDCNIGLKKNETFLYPIIGSPNYIIYWEKEKEEQIQGYIESPYTKVQIHGNGTMRTDQMNYSLSYRNRGQKRREIKIYIGVTKKE
ncbi:hypothetical protein P3W45_000495 [Vairimorpha bombi]